MTNPSIISDGIVDARSFLSGDDINRWCQNFGADPIHPRVIPKRGLVAISYGGGSKPVEEFHVFLVSRGSQAHPRSIRGVPSKPRPT
jgi:hypothetical protein